MPQWWTYTLADFLLFSPRTYRRLFELYNTQTWPAHLLALGAGIAVAGLLWRGGARSRRIASGLLAAAWAWVGWAFLAQHYATVNWAAGVLATAFAVQAALLAASAVAAPVDATRAGATARWSAALLVGFGLIVQPLVGLLLGRPWSQMELFGMVPDPTVTVTLGMLVLCPQARLNVLLWPIPLWWSAVSAATLWAMQDADAAVMPVVAAIALAGAASARKGAGRPSVRPAARTNE